MASTYYGSASAVSQFEPLATTNIASSTNATPIVVTTSSSHGIHEGESVFVYGHLVNTAANGIWKAHIISATQVALLHDDGTNSIGSGIGAATGTTQSLAVGSFAIPADGDDFNAAAFNVPYEALGDIVAFLWRQSGWSPTVYQGGTLSIRSGAFLTANSGALVAMGNGSELFIDSAATLLSAGDLTISSTGRLNLNGVVVHPAPLRPADAATITVDATAGYEAVILPNPASNRIVVVKSTGTANTLNNGTQLELILPPGLANGLYYTIKRQDATVIASLYAWTATGALPGPADATGQPSSVRLNFEGGVWRGLDSAGVTVVGAGW